MIPYHIEFGEVKTKALEEGRIDRKIPLKLGEKPLEYTTKYKYLGQVQNEKTSAEDHIIAVIKGKTSSFPDSTNHSWKQ